MTASHISFRRETRPIILLRWRGEVLLNVFGAIDARRLAGLLHANASFIRRHLSDGSFVELISSVDGKEAGCGSVTFHDEMPSPDNTRGRCAYIMNIYVRPEFRHRGVARATMRTLISLARIHGAAKIYLETTDSARRLYNNLGFKPMNDYLKLSDSDGRNIQTHIPDLPRIRQ